MAISAKRAKGGSISKPLFQEWRKGSFLDLLDVWTLFWTLFEDLEGPLKTCSKVKALVQSYIGISLKDLFEDLSNLSKQGPKRRFLPEIDVLDPVFHQKSTFGPCFERFEQEKAFLMALPNRF